jgi:alkyl sulfatase BDS1-like metallo-beta-lactamase superfamily hydrolase
MKQCFIPAMFKQILTCVLVAITHSAICTTVNALEIQEFSMTTSENQTSNTGLKVADMVKSGNQQEAAIDRGASIFESRGIGNSYLITTAEGSVLVNAGTLKDAKRGKTLFNQVSTQPINTIILTQSHANQFGGVEVYKTPNNQLITHRIYPQDREYAEMLDAHYRRGSRRIFGGITGSAEDMLPTQEIPPDLLIDDYHSFVLGGREFEIFWTPGGETRSALIVWLPEDRIAIVGNLFGPLFGNHPNLNTLRGDKPRSALEFVHSVTKVRALKPVQILTGHEDIRGEAHIQQELTRIIDSVQWVHDRTIEGMNAGVPLPTLMETIKTPDDLALTEEYGKLAWNVRAIWHEYSGWYDPSRGITELYGVRPNSIAPALMELVGSTEKLIESANEFIRAGKPLEALHMLDIVLSANPDSQAGKTARREALERLTQQSNSTNLWERKSIEAELREMGD